MAAYFAPGSPWDSGVILADGVLTARQVLQARLQADLVALSACQTGLAESMGGDELAGLAQAFFQAGTRSLLVSLWSVEDPATAALMTAFHRARQAGADKAQALSQAMAQVQQTEEKEEEEKEEKEEEERWAHTHYWGPFVFMGLWD